MYLKIVKKLYIYIFFYQKIEYVENNIANIYDRKIKLFQRFI